MLFFRRRLVRLHQLDPAPSIEGILVGIHAGHYRLIKPQVVETTDRVHEAGAEVWVPRERVVFLQVLR